MKVVLCRGGRQSESASLPTLLSRSLPVFTSSGTAANATSSNYNNIWTSSGSSATIAIDISTLSTAQKTTNALYWYDESGVDTTTLYFDVGNATGGGGSKNNQPAAYTLEGNTGAGGGSAPGSGWVTLATITNGYASRKHILSGGTSLASYNWVRMNISSSSSSAISLKLDLWDIGGGNRDILLIGDSRKWFGDNHGNPHSGGTACASLSDLMQPSAGFYAPTINTGMSGAKVSDLDALVNGWLTNLGSFHLAIVNGGINDATATTWTSGWSTSYQSLVNKLLAGGVSKVACESIGDSTNPTVHSALAAYNAAIAGIVTATPGCVAGFDEYSFFAANPGDISGDDIHATDAGFAALRIAQAAYYPSLI